MGDVEDGMAKMRAYFQRQRERQNRPIKPNIPNTREHVSNDVSRPVMPPQQPYQQPQPYQNYQQPYQQPYPYYDYHIRPTQQKVRYNFPALGFTMLLVTGVFAYLIYSDSSMMSTIAPFLLTIPQSIRVLCFGGFILSCLALIFVRRK